MVNIINKKYWEAQQVQTVTCTEASYTVGKKLQGKAPGSAAALSVHQSKGCEEEKSLTENYP